MKRRSKSEIQSSYVRPSYLHQAVYKNCEDEAYDSSSEAYDSSSTVDILYNDKYKWGDLDEYHRDNYCSLPCVMPNMTLSGTVYPLDPKIVYSSVPKVSTFFGYTYSSKMLDSSDSSETLGWAGLNLATLVHDAYPDFSENLSISVCVCSENRHTSKPPEGFPSGPIDTFIPEIEYIADGYSHMWEDFWDMSTLNNPFPVDSYTPSPEPEPEPEPEPPSTEYNNYVFIGALTTAPNGGIGAAKVTVDSNGSWELTEDVIQVICLKLN